MDANKNKFIITKYSDEDEYETFSVRVKKRIKEQYDVLADKSGYSRNALIERALQFALDNLEYIDDKE